LKTSGNARPAQAVTVGDGCVGLNIIPLRDGYVGGIDHFGMLVDDVAPVIERMQKSIPGPNVAKRPRRVPFAQYSGHDPDGNVFDLAQKKKTRARTSMRHRGAGLGAGPLSQQVRIRTP